MRLEAAHVSFRYGRKGPWILEDLSLAVESGQRLGLFAPSGYGKSTLARLLAGYLAPQKGKILLDGAALPKKGVCPVQLICQHPEKAINPRWRLKQVLEESGKLRPDVLASFGIETAWLDRFPRELSGGELQRFCVARALMSGANFLICDEISTMLDVITQPHCRHPQPRPGQPGLHPGVRPLHRRKLDPGNPEAPGSVIIEVCLAPLERPGEEMLHPE